MSSVKQNLQYIQNVIEHGEMKKKAPMLLFVIQQIRESVENDPFRYAVAYYMPQNQAHVQTICNYALKYKATLLGDLEDLESHIGAMNGSEKRCLQIIKQLLETDLYRTLVKDKIKKGKALINGKKLMVDVTTINVQKAVK